MKSPRKLAVAALMASLATAALAVPGAASVQAAGQSQPVAADRTTVDQLCADGSPAARVRPGSPRRHDPNEVSKARRDQADQRLRAALAKRRLVPLDDTVTIPVYAHVIHDGKKGKLLTATVQRQVQVLNDAYSGKVGGVATPFRFELKQVKQVLNAKWFEAGYGMVGDEMKSALHAGDGKALNLYFSKLGDDGLLGYATFPDEYASAPKLDGVVVNYRARFGTPDSNFADFAEGDTITHEVGHWLGLYHTFQSGCDTGDLVEDTPAQARPTSGCPTDLDTCPAEGLDPVHNYMDYSSDPCMNEFTVGQVTRMKEQWQAFRA